MLVPGACVIVVKSKKDKGEKLSSKTMLNPSRYL